MPNSRQKTSVFRISDLSEDEIWDIGERQVSARRQEQIRARADIGVSDVMSAGLRVEPETSTHPKHANILGWTGDKEQDKLKAIKLAESAILHIKPTSLPSIRKDQDFPE